MKKILLIGDPELVWMKKYLENVVLKCEGKKFFVLTNKRINDVTWYGKRGITIISPKSSIVNRIPKLSTLYLWFTILRMRKEYKYFDYVHMHFVTYEKILSIPLLVRNANSISITFWGSDLLSKTEKQLIRYKKYFGMINYVTLGSQGLEKRFHEIYGNEFDEKIIAARFGLDGLGYIEKIREKSERLREKLGILSEKKVITIGYNGSKRQNHLLVLEEIKKCSKQVIQQLFLVLPMTYGATPEYILEIEKEISKIGCDYVIYRDFMSNEEIAEIRVITDVFIHAQPTDALSASVQEYLYASKVVINPKWINYYELKEQGLYYWEYGSFAELSKMITDYCQKPMSESQRVRLEDNRRKIEDYSSWKKLRPIWENLYN